MKNRFLLLVLGFVFVSFTSFSQIHGVCGTHEGCLDEDKKNHPKFYESIEERNLELEQEYNKILRKLPIIKSSNGKKIIPVVVHVIYDDQHGGNITNEEIQGALDILNENFNGQAANFLQKTPDIFLKTMKEKL